MSKTCGGTRKILLPPVTGAGYAAMDCPGCVDCSPAPAPPTPEPAPEAPTTEYEFYERQKAEMRQKAEILRRQKPATEREEMTTEELCRWLHRRAMYVSLGPEHPDRVHLLRAVATIERLCKPAPEAASEGPDALLTPILMRKVQEYEAANRDLWQAHAQFQREIAALREQLTKARAFGEKAAKLYNDTLVLRCAFCGEAYPDGTPPSRHERLTAHVAVCEKHPMRAVEAKLTQREAALREIASRACHPRCGPDALFCPFCYAANELEAK